MSSDAQKVDETTELIEKVDEEVANITNSILTSVESVTEDSQQLLADTTKEVQEALHKELETTIISNVASAKEEAQKEIEIVIKTAIDKQEEMHEQIKEDIIEEIKRSGIMDKVLYVCACIRLFSKNRKQDTLVAAPTTESVENKV